MFICNNIFADSQLSNAFSPITSTEKGIIICFNDLHDLKAFPEILLTEDGIEISLSEMHPSKHDCSILLNVGDWNVTSVSDLQLEKEKLSISFIDEDISTFCYEVQSEKLPL